MYRQFLLWKILSECRPLLLMSGPSFINILLEVLTALKKEFAACIIKISSWTTLKMEAAGSTKTLITLQIDILSYPRRPVSSIFNNFVTVLWHTHRKCCCHHGICLEGAGSMFLQNSYPATRLHFINPEHHIMNIYCCENSKLSLWLLFLNVQNVPKVEIWMFYALQFILIFKCHY